MRKLLTVLLFTVTFAANAQSQFSGSLGFGINEYLPKSHPGFEHHYYPGAGYSISASLGYFLTDAVEIQLRTSIDDVNYTTTYTWVAIQPNDPAIPYSTNYNHMSLNLGLGSCYRKSFGDKNALCLSGAIETSVASTGDEVSVMGNNTVKSTNYLTKSIPGIRAGIGWQYAVSPRLGLQLLPEIKVFFRELDLFSSRYPIAIYCTLNLCLR